MGTGTAKWSRDSDFFRGLCTNQLKFEDDGGMVLGENCPPLCVHPYQRGPVQGCAGCDVLERPAGFPHVISLKLQNAMAELGGGTKTSTYSASSNWTSSVDAYSITSNYNRSTERRWSNCPTDETFQLRNYEDARVERGYDLNPQRQASVCDWFWIDGLVEIKSVHSTITESELRQATHGPTTYDAYGLTKLADSETEEFSVSLSNSDPFDADLMLRGETSRIYWFDYHRGLQALSGGTLGDNTSGDTRIWYPNTPVIVDGYSAPPPTAAPPFPDGRLVSGYFWNQAAFIYGWMWRLTLAGNPALRLYAVRSVQDQIITSFTGHGAHLRSSSTATTSYTWQNIPSPAPMAHGNNFPGTPVDNGFGYDGREGGFLTGGTSSGSVTSKPFGDGISFQNWPGVYEIARWRFDTTPLCSLNDWQEMTLEDEYTNLFSNPTAPVAGPGSSIPPKVWVNIGSSGL